jgi:hypothetical protein
VDKTPREKIMPKYFAQARKQNPLLDKIIAEHEQIMESVAEWICEGWGLDVAPTGPMIAAALFNEATTQDSIIKDEAKAGRQETHLGYPAYLRNLAFSVLAACGHSPLVVVNQFGGLVQGVFADSPVDVVVVDWDQQGIGPDDFATDPCLFKWNGKIGRSYNANCFPLGDLEPETWYAVACALFPDGDDNPAANDGTVQHAMALTGQTY